MTTSSELATPFVGEACFIEPPTWQGVAKQLVHLTQFSGGIQVIDGESKSGKTVFANYLSGLLSEEVSCGVLALPAGLATQQVFECLLETVGAEVQDGQSVGQSIIALRKYDSVLKQEQVRKVLIIDDAHRLDDQALAALASIFQGVSDNEVGLALVLVAEPGVAQRLDALNLVDVEVRDCALPGFSLQETKDLLAEVFSARFPEREFPLDDEIVTALWSESAGRPGEVLQLAQLAWQETSSSHGRPWWQAVPLLHVAALIALLSALIWGYFARDLSPEVPPVGGAAQQPVAVASSAQLGQSSVAASSLAVAASSSVKPPELTKQDFETFGVNEPVIERALAVSSSAAKAKQAGEPSQPPVAEIAQPAQQPQPVKPAKAAQPAKEPQSVQKSQHVQKSQPIIAARLPEPELEGLTGDERALMHLPKRGFVLQVLAANSRKSLEDFVAEQSNKANLRIYRSIRSGKSWYVVVEGYYADKGSALAAMSNLPASQLKAGPWPKSTAAVKLEIEAYKQQLRPN